jgi:predicted nuclease of restriction endonuclease-like (RecB) superfamily
MTTDRLPLPDDYADVLAELTREVRQARVRAHRVVNTELVRLYWTIGNTILGRQATQGWGAEFPVMTGLSRSNLHYMRLLAGEWSAFEIVQQPVGQLPWGHITVLLDKLEDRPNRDWYAAHAVSGGWSRAVLLNQIMSDARGRSGAAVTNFTTLLPEPDSDLVRQLVKDPYVFDFLNLTERAAERDVEKALVANLQQFLLELGHGFAFVGRQYRFTVDGDDFVIDGAVLQLRPEPVRRLRTQDREVHPRACRPARQVRRMGPAEPHAGGS